MTCSPTTPERPSDCSGARSPCRGESTSRSASRLASSGSSCRGTSRCRSPSWGFAPALAAGNTVVLKPADLTPLTAIRLGELALEAGIPEDVLQVLPGRGLGRRAGGSSRTRPSRKVCFTGSTRGRPDDHGGVRRAGEAGHARARGQERQHRLCRRRPRGRGRLSTVWRSSTTPARTAAPARGILVEASAYERFMELLESAVKAAARHRPRRRASEMGPLISAEQHARRGAPSCLTTRRSPSAGSAPDGAGLLVPADGARPGRPTAGVSARRSSARSSRSSASRTRRTRSASPTTPPTGSRARSGPGTSGARSASRGRSRREPSR